MRSAVNVITLLAGLALTGCLEEVDPGVRADADREAGDARGAADDDAAPTPDAGDPPETATPNPLSVSPALLDFGAVPRQTTKTMLADVLNLGADPLILDRFRFTGHLGFSAVIGDHRFTITAESATSGVPIVPPITIAPGSSERVVVRYGATGYEGAQATLVFSSDAPGVPEEGVELRLVANLRVPCIRINPARPSFGGTLVGVSSELQLEIGSCGDIELSISDIEMIDDGGGVFGVSPSLLGGLPAIVPAGASLWVPVTYRPAAVAQPGADGQPTFDRGVLRIRSNATQPELDVPLAGFGVDRTGDLCPTARITVREGQEVLPQTVLHLSGLGSTAPTGAIASYEWSVVQPSGSVSVFSPSPYVGELTFEANIVGTYIFRLNVRDTMGTVSCSPAEYTVFVTSDDAIHIELLWDTPGDLNQTDTGGDQIYFSVGTDLDLHFLHPKADGKYFDWSYDCYWDNVQPEWGIFSPVDNPRLDRDDTDGAGPENLNVAVPEQGARYQVGVHYWNDWGYGTSFATVRVYVYGVLRDQWEGVRLDSDDMWDSHYIDWPSGLVTRIGEAPRITHGFRAEVPPN